MGAGGARSVDQVGITALVHLVRPGGAAAEKTVDRRHDHRSAIQRLVEALGSTHVEGQRLDGVTQHRTRAAGVADDHPDPLAASQEIADHPLAE